ncbi:hypothetical protein [Roseovarius sp. M141]|uniref:hypothetical protein n=1 Tax=Roseovarius sp. M141 TaxID=2583806 RepID=UPI0020CC2A1F|nr:hypothetical protein [Roseovarius sp. M141]MCQ0093504.1 hypothetical protein [Roseovarius sp. M141]
MKPNELREKIQELEAVLDERMSEVSRTKTQADETQMLSDIRKRVDELALQADQIEDDEEKLEAIRKADEILLELRAPRA